MCRHSPTTMPSDDMFGVELVVVCEGGIHGQRGQSRAMRLYADPPLGRTLPERLAS